MNKGTLIIHSRNKRQAIVVSDKPYAKFYQDWNPHGWGDYGSAHMAVRIKYVDCGNEQVMKVASIKSNFEVAKPATTHPSESQEKK